MQNINVMPPTKLLGTIGLALAVTHCGSTLRELGEDPAQIEQHIAPLVVDKLDVLLVVDNSRSMADKQTMLSDAIPTLFRRFITPPLRRRPRTLHWQAGRCARPMSQRHATGNETGVGRPHRSHQ